MYRSGRTGIRPTKVSKSFHLDARWCSLHFWPGWTWIPIPSCHNIPTPPQLANEPSIQRHLVKCHNLQQAPWESTNAGKDRTNLESPSVVWLYATIFILDPKHALWLPLTLFERHLLGVPHQHFNAPQILEIADCECWNLPELAGNRPENGQESKLKTTWRWGPLLSSAIGFGGRLWVPPCFDLKLWQGAGSSIARRPNSANICWGRSIIFYMGYFEISETNMNSFCKKKSQCVLLRLESQWARWSATSIMRFVILKESGMPCKCHDRW